MEVTERLTCLEALAAFAWADGAVDESERSRIQEFLAGASDLSKSEVAGLIDTVRELSPGLVSRISELPPERACELLAVADAMCYADHTPTVGEVNLLRRIGTARFGEKNWPTISGWLENQRQANALLDELLESP
jgi:uncharacterized tellurite resistance protein B-like protein